MKSKLCLRCNKTKPLTAFHYSRVEQKLECWCKQCEREYNRDKGYDLKLVEGRKRTLNPYYGSYDFRKIYATHMGLKEKELGRTNVHHVDGNGRNKDIHNLIGLTTSTHRRIHRVLDKGRRPIQVVYLAGPLEGVVKSYAFDWRQFAYDRFASNGIVSLIPGKEQCSLFPEEIVDLDITMIQNSNALLMNLDFLLDNKLKGTGTLCEMGIARFSHIPIIGFTNGRSLDKFKFVRGCIAQLFPSKDEAIQMIVDLNRGI